MKENGFEYVDLGLPSKTMWATCNVGANKPEDSGLLFQFGRVDGYKYGDKNNQFRVPHQNKQDTGSALIPLTPSGKTYNMGETLNLKDDAVHVHMGGKWRMPTGRYNSSKQFEGEWVELINNTKHDVVTINGAQGMMFTSNINGHKLFIPFMKGYWYDYIYYEEGSNVFLWSSQVDTSYRYRAYGLYCSSNGYTYLNSDLRNFAFSMRGVFRK